MTVVKLNLSGHANSDLDAMGFIFPGALHVDLADPDLFNKVVAFLRPLVNSGDIVHIAPPGLSPLAIMVVTAIHGLTGTFPHLVPLIRSDAGFVPGNSIDLQSIRNDVARTSRDNIVNL